MNKITYRYSSPHNKCSIKDHVVSHHIIYTHRQLNFRPILHLNYRISVRKLNLMSQIPMVWWGKGLPPFKIFHVVSPFDSFFLQPLDKNTLDKNWNQDFLHIHFIYIKHFLPLINSYKCNDRQVSYNFLLVTALIYSCKNNKMFYFSFFT